ncbi:MAG: hypothetical protein ACK5QH_12485 [Rubrivivax sp.]
MRVHPQVHSRRTALQALACTAAVAAWPALALEKPTGPVVLTLSGKLRSPNDGKRAQFDMAMLEKLPQTSFSTRTPWYSQPRKFTGPLLRDVLAAAGAGPGQGATTLRATALNDYWVELPLEDAARYDLIVARLLDDKPMAVRDKGPLFMIYPFDALPELRNPVFYSRSAWQLRSLELR